MRTALSVLALGVIACNGDKEPEDTGDDFVHPFEGHAFLGDEFMNIAHRGGAHEAPEETFAAFDNAIAVGADVLELDLYSTADDVLVCMHDDTVDRTTDGTGAIRGFTLEELQQLDAGYWYTEDGGATYPYRGEGLTVPTFRGVLERYPNALLSVEIKQRSPSIVDQLIADLDEFDARDRVTVGSFEDGPLVELRAAAPDIMTSLAVTEGLAFYYLTPEAEETYTPPGWILAAPMELGEIVLDEATIEKARRNHIWVHVWTINDRTEMETIIDMGADGIITDEPTLLGEVMSDRGI